MMRVLVVKMMKRSFVLAVAIAMAVPASAQPRRIPEGFVLAVGGDLLGPYDVVSPQLDADHKKIISLFQGADAGFANAEASIFDRNSFKGWAAPMNGGGIPLHSPAAAMDFKRMGVDLFSLANNHATDWGTEGMAATVRTMDSLGLAYAGGGMSLKAARAPGYFQSPKGRVALVATASTFTALSPAADATDRTGPRPGASTLATTSATLVSQEEMDALAKVAATVGGGRGRGGAGTPGPRNQLTLGGARFQVSTRRGQTYQANPRDVSEIVGSVTEAERNADLVVLSIHAHETSSGPNGESIPGDFLPDFFHTAIDSGADVVVRHGPHGVGGVEIYKGRPIFYDMGSLFFSLGNANREMTSNGRPMQLPTSYYESMIALVEFRGGTLHEVRLYPTVFDAAGGPVKGVPKPAPPETAARILESIRVQSLAHGTVVRIENGVGIVRP